MSRLLPAAPTQEAGRYRPFETGAYDRSPLTLKERAALEYMAYHTGGGGLKRNYELLERLVRPIRDATAFAGGKSTTYNYLRRRIFLEMHRRTKTFWEFSEEEWTETVRLCDPGTKTHALVVSYLLGGLSGLRLMELDWRPRAIARKAFGTATIDRVLERLGRATEGWGYAPQGECSERLKATLCRALLLRRSPYPEDVTQEAMDTLFEQSRSAQTRKSARLLSRIVYAAGAAVWPTRDPREAPQQERQSAEVADGNQAEDRVPPEWRNWCDRWLATSTLASREHVHMYLLKVGRWLAEAHPSVQSPKLEYVAAVDRMKTGEWGAWWAHHNPKRAGKPSQPRSKDHQIYAARAFFRDLQEWGWIPVRFDPGRCLRTPRSIANLIGPDPRTIDAAVWAKLVAAGLGLEAEDLPRGCPYPVELVRALAAVWLFAGLRADEIVRLCVGCARRQRSDVTVAATGENLKKDELCFLEVPTNKTSTAFTKPIHPVVERRIAEWERKRPQVHPELRQDKPHHARREVRRLRLPRTQHGPHRGPAGR